MLISENWKQVPKPIKLFLLKGVIFFSLWKLLYVGMLLPHRVLDQPLTYAIGMATTETLNSIQHSGEYRAQPGMDIKTTNINGAVLTENVIRIYYHRQKVLSVADACNGLELIVLYLGFIICFPSRTLRKAVFILMGIVLITIANIARCTALVYLFLHNPDWVDFSHHYLFTFLVYGLIAGLWFRFIRLPALPGKFETHVALQS